MMEQNFLQALLQTPGYICWKDLQSIFIGGNNNFLKITGLQSFDELHGKSDYDMPWGKTHAKIYIAADQEVFQGIPKLNYYETQLQAHNKLVGVNVNKIPLLDSNRKTSGLICHYYEVKNLSAPKNLPNLSVTQKKCLCYIIKGFSAKQIAQQMNLSYRTIEYYTDIIKHKLNCSNKAELISKSLSLNLVSCH